MPESEFDRYAGCYHEQHEASIGLSGEAPDFFAKYKVEDVAAAVAKSGTTPRRILDLGGGIGNSLPHMRRCFPNSEIVVLDPSLESLRIAEARFPGAGVFRHFDGRAIPYEDCYFDLAFTACVFHHVPAEIQIDLLREVKRVLGPEGHFFLFEHNPYNPLTAKAVKSCPFDENAVLIDAGTMRRRLALAGFPRTAVSYRLFFPRVLSAFRPAERFLTKVPLGAQYYVHAANLPR